MKFFKKNDYIYKFLLFILVLSLILTIINSIFYLNNNINSIISLISILSYSLIIGIKRGLKIEEKAYKEGLKIGIIFVTILYILNCLTLNFSLHLKKIVYFLIIIITTILGSIIGINKKNSK